MPKFKIPDGFEVPPDAEDEFTVVARLKANDDGTLTLLEIDGAKIKGYEKDDKKKPDDDMYGRMKKAGFKP